MEPPEVCFPAQEPWEGQISQSESFNQLGHLGLWPKAFFPSLVLSDDDATGKGTNSVPPSLLLRTTGLEWKEKGPAENDIHIFAVAVHFSCEINHPAHWETSCVSRWSEKVLKRGPGGRNRVLLAQAFIWVNTPEVTWLCFYSWRPR